MYSNIARKKVSYRGLSFVLRENTQSIYRTKIHRRKENEKIFCNVQIKQNGGVFMRIVTYDLEKNENDMPMLVKESSQNCPSISNSITDPGEAVAVLNQALQLDRKMEEHFCLIAMRSKKVIGIFKVNVGTINNSLVNTAGIFTRLLLCGATHFIIAHNHPSGNVSPSPEDEKVTENIQKISEMMGIVFYDHIIIGSGYFSFLEQNML